MAASPKRICEQCKAEEIPDPQRWFTAERQPFALVVRKWEEGTRHAELCGERCVIRFMSQWAANQPKSSEYSPENLERLAKR